MWQIFNQMKVKALCIIIKSQQIEKEIPLQDKEDPW